MFQLNLILIGTLLHCVLSVSDYFFVASPNVIRFDNEETVYVGVFGSMKNVAIKIWIEHQQKILSSKTVTVLGEEHPHQTTILVQERDISKEVNKPRLLKLCGQRVSDGQKSCRDVILSYQTGYIIVQTDKPIYTAQGTVAGSERQIVKIRALALDESLQQIQNTSRLMAIDIVSPSNLTLGRKIFPLKELSGFYQHAFTLPQFPELGVWTARAFYKGLYETVATSRFYVEEYVLPTFDVKIKVSEPVILPLSSTILRITVEAEYVYGKPVAGTARLTLNVTVKTESRFILTMDRKPLENGKTEFSLDSSAILSSPALQDNFPEGSRLTVIATVFETATANEEATYHDSTIFATYPFKIQFSRSYNYFRPGMDFFLKVDMLKTNDEPADNQNITMLMFDNGECINQGSVIKNVITKQNGHATAVFKMPKESAKICFQVKTSDGQKSDPFYVTSYKGKNQVLVEQITDEGNMRVMVTSNMNQVESKYTGMILMIVTRGKIAYAKFQNAPRINEFIDKHIEELLIPSARLMVFYIDDNTKEVVTDSVRIQVEERCRGTNLAVDGTQRLIPGANEKLKISGEPFAWVGLNIVDKAVLLLNKGDILKKNMIFQALESHDLGCGSGSGMNSGDVLKNAGMTLVTNAVVTDDVDVNQYYQCGLKRRKRRDTECLYGAGSNCCEYGREYGETLFFEADEDDRPTIDPYTKCYASARNLTQDENIPTRCIMAYFHSCQNELEYLKSDVTHIVSKSIADVTAYEADLTKVIDGGIMPRTRSDFRESFLFDEVLLDGSGKAEKMTDYPDSITKWMVQAIGISPNKGICIADPFEVEVFREFFIQLELPYTTSRFELLNIKATIFSYLNGQTEDAKVKVYLEGVDGLCYSGIPGQPSEPMTIDLGPNSAKSVNFPVVPVKAGHFPVTVTAISTHLGIPQVDKIKKYLYVVHEGIPKQINILACLDPNNQMADCASDKERVSISKHVEGKQYFNVNLRLPEGYIHGTGSATGFLYGAPIENVVRAMVNGVTNLFRIPSGCTEQTAASFAPNVFAMMYLKRTGQVTANVEEIGNKNIREGVNREVSMFMKSDGSYYKYRGHNVNTDSSVWLTAFVAKLLCHSKKLVDDAVDEKDHLHETIRWLNSKVTDGKVNEESNIGRLSYVSMGNLDTSSPAMNAFWLITMLECGVLQEEIKPSVKAALEFIENKSEWYMKSEPYVLAISTYALALGDSNQKWTFKKWLGDIARNQNGENLFWGKNNEDNSYNVETTAYALLAMLKFDDLKSCGPIVRWLTTQQNAYGVFKSTQDTVVGLQALAEYSIRTFTPNVDIQVRFTMGRDWLREIPLTNQEFGLQSLVEKIPVEKEDTMLQVKVDGTSGSGRLRIELHYNVPPQKNETCPFNISNIEIGTVVDYDIDANINKARQCDVCGLCVLESSIAHDSYFTTPEPDNNVHSNFGRRKRQADTGNKKERCIRFTASAKDGRDHGMSMILFGLETSVTVIEEDLEMLMKNNPNLGQYELPSDGKGYIAFYLNTLTTQPNDFVFRLVDEFNGSVSTRQPATVTVFDYYKPEYKCIQMYNSASGVDTKVDIQCSDGPKNKQCNCLQSICSQSVEEEILEMVRNSKKPAASLYQYTCNPEKANYAMSVKVLRVWNDSVTKSNLAEARVIQNIHRGANANNHTNGMLVSFTWKNLCAFPSMSENSTYYIIGKDDYQVVEQKVRYTLMGTALVIKYPENTDQNDDRILTTVLINYKTMIAGRGCPR